MPILDEWARLRKQLDAQDAAVLQRLIDAYGNTYQRVNAQIETLLEKMQADFDAGKLTRAGVKSSAAYRNLIGAISAELNDYEGYLKTELRTSTNKAAVAGLSAGSVLLTVALADALGVAVKDVPSELVRQTAPDALAFLQGYLDKLGPRIDELSNYHSEQIAAGILERVAEGNNPRVIADWITDAYGMGLTDSMRMTRTAQLYSYRQSANAVQVANADLLEGVVWCAELDDRVCMSCISLHGTVFPVGTLADDHHNGRCAMLPIVKGQDNPIQQTGEQWFTAQPETSQRDMMGPGKYEAWSEGKFTFDQLSTTHEDDVFGQMRGEASLKGLLGEND
jgi:hypothetical protein